MHAVVQVRREQTIPTEFNNVEFISELGKTTEWSGEVKIWQLRAEEKWEEREVLERIVIHKSFLQGTAIKNQGQRSSSNDTNELVYKTETDS